MISAIVTKSSRDRPVERPHLGFDADEAAALEINVVDSAATTEAVRYHQYDVPSGR